MKSAKKKSALQAPDFRSAVGGATAGALARSGVRSKAVGSCELNYQLDDLTIRSTPALAADLFRVTDPDMQALDAAPDRLMAVQRRSIGQEMLPRAGSRLPYLDAESRRCGAVFLHVGLK